MAAAPPTRNLLRGGALTPGTESYRPTGIRRPVRLSSGPLSGRYGLLLVS